MIRISSKTANVVWSQNHIQVTLEYQGLNSGNSIEVQLINYTTSDVLSTLRYPITGSSGYLNMLDLQEIIDPHLNFSIPNTLKPTLQSQIRDYPGATMQVRLRFREYGPDYNNASWEEDWTNIFTVVKGGIGDMTFTEEYYVNFNGVSNPATFFPFEKPFLTYLENNSLLHIDEWAFLTYFHVDAAYKPQFWYSIFYDDGTSQLVKRNPFYGVFNNNHVNRIWYIPIGINQASLNNYKKPVKMEVSAVGVDGAGNFQLFYSTYKFVIDHRPVYRPLNLFYRNSTGGIDNIYLRGVKEYNSATFKKYQHSGQLSPYQSGGTSQNFFSEGKITLEANTGFISRNRAAMLFDLFNNKGFCAIRAGEQFWHLNVPEQDMKAISSEDGLVNYSIKLESAGGFKSLPRQIKDLIK